MNTHLSSVALLLVVATAAVPARAGECAPSDGFSTCFASDNLWPQVGGSPWFSQAPTQTSPGSSASFGFVPSYIHRPIGLVVASPDPEGTTIYAAENALAATFLIGVGVTDRAQVHIAAPVMLYQEGASKSDVVGSDIALPRSAVGDMRFGASLSILQRERLMDGPGLSARFEMAAPTGNTDAFVGYSTATYAPGVAFDYRVGPVELGADIGARIRDHVTIAGAVIGTQLTASLGVGYQFLDDDYLSANLEVFALVSPFEQSQLITQPGSPVPEVVPTTAVHAPMEWLLSLRTAGALDGRLRASLGAGSFIPVNTDALGVTTPAFRLAASLHYAFAFTDAEE